ncbi:hypothetical protein X777_05166, partial [Ooceraea biroi]
LSDGSFDARIVPALYRISIAALSRLETPVAFIPIYVETLALSSFVAASGFTRPLARFSTRLRSLTREMDTFLIIGICFLCYEMCDLIMRYAAPQAPIETHHAAETATATTKASSSQKVYSISRKIQGPPACCPQ